MMLVTSMLEIVSELFICIVHLTRVRLGKRSTTERSLLAMCQKIKILSGT
jgi:hypothetical protein